MSKIKILVVGDSLALNTGLSYVGASWSRLLRQSNKYEVAYANITGAPVKVGNTNIIALDEDSDILKDMQVYNLIDPQSQMNDFSNIIKDFHPQIIFSIHDPWMVEVLAYSEYRSSYYWIAYTTVEIPKYTDRVYNQSYITGMSYKSILDTISKADLIIPVTRMGMEALLSMGLKNVYDDNVYNGLDLSKECTEEVKKSVLFEGAVSDDSFLFMTMGVNAERKMLDRTLETFATFLGMVKDPDKFKLYLHTNIYISLGGTDLPEIIRELGIGKWIIALGNSAYIPRSYLYRFYKASDCYIGFPGGEGFGYGYAEAMLHGKPLVYSNYGGHAEYAQYAGLKVDVNEYSYAMRIAFKWGLVDIKDAADKMWKISNPKEIKLRKEFSEKGKKFCLNNFGWNTVYSKLDKIIEDNYNQAGFKSFYGWNIKKIV